MYVIAINVCNSNPVTTVNCCAAMKLRTCLEEHDENITQDGRVPSGLGPTLALCSAAQNKLAHSKSDDRWQHHQLHAV